MSYKYQIEQCYLGPKRGGVPIKELRTLAQNMGIDNRDKNGHLKVKGQLCNEMALKLGQSSGNIHKIVSSDSSSTVAKCPVCPECKKCPEPIPCKKCKPFLTEKLSPRVLKMLSLHRAKRFEEAEKILKSKNTPKEDAHKFLEITNAEKDRRHKRKATGKTIYTYKN